MENKIETILIKVLKEDDDDEKNVWGYVQNLCSSW